MDARSTTSFSCLGTFPLIQLVNISCTSSTVQSRYEEQNGKEKESQVSLNKPVGSKATNSPILACQIHLPLKCLHCFEVVLQHKIQDLIFPEQVSRWAAFLSSKGVVSKHQESILHLDLCWWNPVSVQVSPDRSQIIDLIEEPMLKVELDSVVGLIQETLGEHSIKGIKKNHCIISCFQTNSLSRRLPFCWVLF